MVMVRLSAWCFFFLYERHTHGELSPRLSLSFSRAITLVSHVTCLVKRRGGRRDSQTLVVIVVLIVQFIVAFVVGIVIGVDLCRESWF